MDIEYREQKYTFTKSGGQLTGWKYKKNGEYKDIMYSGSVRKRSGMPILYPFADPLENGILLSTQTQLPQHGFLRNIDCELTRLDETRVVARYKHDNRSNWWQQYPFEHSVDIWYSLAPDMAEHPGNSDDKAYLSCTISVHNAGKQDMPVAPGLHPYWAIDHAKKSEVRIQGEKPAIDWQNPPSEGTYTASRDEMMFEFPWGRIKQSASFEFKHLVLWTQPPTADDSDFICLEPFTRSTNGINTEPILIQPDMTWKSRVEWTVTEY